MIPALAESLQRGVIFEDAGDPRDAARKADAWARFKQTALAFLFLRRDRFTGEWVEDRNKTVFWVILAFALCAFAFFWYQRASTAAAFRQPVSAQQASVQGAATGGALTGGVTGGEPSGATLPREPASTSFNLRASLDEFSAAQVSGGAGEAAPTGGAPVATPAPAPAPAPAPEAEPIESAIVLERAGTPNETVAFVRPEQEGSDVLRSTPAAGVLFGLSPIVQVRQKAERRAEEAGPGSAIVFQRDPSTSSAPIHLKTEAKPRPIPSSRPWTPPFPSMSNLQRLSRNRARRGKAHLFTRQARRSKRTWTPKSRRRRASL